MLHAAMGRFTKRPHSLGLESPTIILGMKKGPLRNPSSNQLAESWGYSNLLRRFIGFESLPAFSPAGYKRLAIA